MTAFYLLDGFKLITQPGLRRYAVVPFIANIILFILFFMLIRHYIGEWSHDSSRWFSILLWLVMLSCFFLVMVYTFVTTVNLLCAPFNSFLAEKVELTLTGVIKEPRTLADNIKDIPRIVGRQLCILGYYFPRALLILILFFIPIVQIAAPIVWFLFHAWFMTMTYIDYPTDNHRVSMQDVRVWLSQRRLTALLFGMSVLVASMIPIVNCFTVPAAVAAATEFWLKENRR